MQVECIDKITRFITASEGQQLVGRQVDGMQYPADTLHLDRRKKAPDGIPRPVDEETAVAYIHLRTGKAWIIRDPPP